MRETTGEREIGTSWREMMGPKGFRAQCVLLLLSLGEINIIFVTVRFAVYNHQRLVVLVLVGSFISTVSRSSSRGCFTSFLLSMVEYLKVLIYLTKSYCFFFFYHGWFLLTPPVTSCLAQHSSSTSIMFKTEAVCRRLADNGRPRGRQFEIAWWWTDWCYVFKEGKLQEDGLNPTWQLSEMIGNKSESGEKRGDVLSAWMKTDGAAAASLLWTSLWAVKTLTCQARGEHYLNTTNPWSCCRLLSPLY